VSLFKRGNIWWFKFKFAGREVRESSKSTSKTVAREAERNRRRELEEGYNGIPKRQRARIFSVLANEWLTAQSAHLAPHSVTIERLNLKHLKPFFGGGLLCDISANEIARYQSARLGEGAAPKTVNLEVGTLRAILRKNRVWSNLQPDVKMLRAPEDLGRALTADEETTLLKECRDSRSRSLYLAVELALGTCMRYSEIRLLLWRQIDLGAGEVRVGKSKSQAGEGRVIPLNSES